MARWSRIQTHVQSRFQVVATTDESLTVQWTWRDGRTQAVELHLRSAFDREILHLRSAFAKANELDPAAMFRMNRELPFATIALDGDTWFIVYSALLKNLSMEEVEFCVARVAAVADALEERFLDQDIH